MMGRISWQPCLVGVACVLTTLVGCRTGVETAASLDRAPVPGRQEAARYQWVEYLDGVPVSALAPEGDGMWVALGRSEDSYAGHEEPPGSLVRMDIATGQRVGYSPPDGLGRVYDIAIDAEGTKWIGTVGGVIRFDGQEWETYGEDFPPHWESDQQHSPGSIVNAVAVDSTGQIWCANSWCNGDRAGYGVMVFNGRDWRWLTGPSEIEGWRLLLRQIWVEQIVPDAAGGVWLLQGRWEGGLLLHYRGGGQWRTFTQFRDDVHPRPNAAAIDKEGRLWFGTNDGVIAFDGRDWRSYGPEQGVHGPVDAITTDGQGRVWATTEDAVICFEEGKWRKCARLFQLQDVERERCYWINDVAIDSMGRLWVATIAGLKVLEEAQEG